MSKKVANTLVWHARKGLLTGIWSPNKIVNTMNIRREVPTNYSNILKANIKNKINARKNINSARKNRALGALNVLFTKKPELRPEPEPEANLNIFPSNNRRQRQTQAPKSNNNNLRTARQHREAFGNNF